LRDDAHLLAIFKRKPLAFDRHIFRAPNMFVRRTL
jgi:hypothetical protein